MPRVHKEPGVYQGHCSCPDCGSSDAGALYLHVDGTYSLACFSGGCDYSALNVDPNTLTVLPGSGGRVIDMAEEKLKMADMAETLGCIDNPERRLYAEAYERYGCLMDTNAVGDIDAIYYPTYRDGEHVGYRNRKRFRPWMSDVKKKPELDGKLKCFYGGVGDLKVGIEMFGQWKWAPGGDRLVITCGEEDAIVTLEMLMDATKHGKGYPTVSVPSGETVQGVKPNLKWISSFENIYIISDQDEAGRKFEEDLCKMLPVGKVHKVRLPEGCKDPSQMWTKAKSRSGRKQAAKTLYNALFNAEKYSPAGVKSLSEGWSSYLNRGTEVMVNFPEAFGALNYLTGGGYALGEIINIIAASSTGKSSIVKEMLEEALLSTPYNIGVVSLEESIDEFIEGQLSIRMSEQLNEIPDDERDRKKEWESFQELCYYLPEDHRPDDYDPKNRTERIHYVDHQGSCQGEELLEKIDFLINGLDCKIIVVDPVTLAFSGRDTDEDDMASEIVKRVKRHKVAWINVHHVRKSNTGAQANSEGADLAEEDIKGCMSNDTEFLTPTGWKRIDEFEEGDLVAEYDPVTKKTSFREPKHYVKLPCNEGLHHIKTVKGIDTMVSGEHTMYFQKQRSEELHKITADEMVEKHYQLSQGFRGRFETVSAGHQWGPGIDLTDDEIRLEVAFQADGTRRHRVNNPDSSYFNLKKGRKKDRLRELCESAGVTLASTESTTREGYTNFYCTLPWNTKTFTGEWYNINEHQARVIFEECSKWDGHEGDFRAYFNNCKESCDFIQTIAMGLGVRSTITKELPSESSPKRTGNCYWVRFVEKASSTVSMAHKDGPIPIEKVPAPDGYKYCFVTHSGVWVSRRNGRIMMTGNTGAWFQTGMINLIFTRDKTHDNPTVRNTMKGKMSKCRRHGKNTGTFGYIWYDGVDGRLKVGESPESILGTDDGKEGDMEFE